MFFSPIIQKAVSFATKVHGTDAKQKRKINAYYEIQARHAEFISASLFS